MWREDWPPVLCPRGGIHDWLEFPTGIVCDACGVLVRGEDAGALMAWWNSFPVRRVRYERN